MGCGRSQDKSGLGGPTTAVSRVNLSPGPRPLPPALSPTSRGTSPLHPSPHPPSSPRPTNPEFRSLSLTWSLQTPHLAAHRDPSASPVGR